MGVNVTISTITHSLEKMMIRKSHIFAFTLGLIPFVATMFFLNIEQFGPKVIDKQQYLGCYSYEGKPVLSIDEAEIKDLKFSRSAKIKGIISVKDDAAINTEEELFFDPAQSLLEIGDRETGFFYVFRIQSSSKSLILYDRQGREHSLEKRPC